MDPQRPALYVKTALFTAIVVLSNVLGNFSLSWGFKHGAAKLNSSPFSFIQILFSPWVAMGVLLLILWLLCRMTLLSWADLSFVLPVTSIGYVLTALLGKWLLLERVTMGRWAGAVLIMMGSVLVGLTPHSTGGVRPDSRS